MPVPNTIADIVARSGIRRVLTFDSESNSTTLSGLLAAGLRSLGWTANGPTSFTSRSIGNVTDDFANTYARSVTITWEIVDTITLRYTLSEPSGLLVHNQPLFLRAIGGKCLMMGGPYQFLIIPTVVAVDRASCLVSVLNLPRFSNNLTAIVGMEAGSFFRNLHANDFNNFMCFSLSKARIATINNPTNGSLSAGSFSIPTYQAKVISAFVGQFGVKSPAWVTWGNESTSSPLLRGFLWDMFLWYDNRFTSAFEREVIDTRASIKLCSVASNILVFEYGNAQ